MEVLANTVTERNKRMLYDLTAKFAHKDWAAVNRKNGRHNRKDNCGRAIHKPYSMGYETEEALSMYHLALQDDLTLEQIGNIKAYLMLQRQLGNIE